MKVLIIGDEPSRHNTDPNIAFIGAKCYPRLLEWIKVLGLTDYELINSNTIDLMIKIEQHSGINITLGIKAHKRLLQGGIPHLRLPHPSGLNRQINNPEKILVILNGTKNILEILSL